MSSIAPVKTDEYTSEFIKCADANKTDKYSKGFFDLVDEYSKQGLPSVIYMIGELHRRLVALDRAIERQRNGGSAQELKRRLLAYGDYAGEELELLEERS